MVEDGAVWVGVEECTVLQCSGGVIESFPIGCPAPPSEPGCQRISAPRLCCPFYVCPADGSECMGTTLCVFRVALEASPAE